MDISGLLMRVIFQSTPPVWGATDAGQATGAGGQISIHAPRVGGDSLELSPGCTCSNFNPRPPCGGRPGLRQRALPGETDFNPRPPCGGRLGAWRTTEPSPWYFNPRPPCGGRPQLGRTSQYIVGISIHAPRVGGDAPMRACSQAPRNFNPRPPCGGRLRANSAPHSSQVYFNPRPPCGGRP